MVMVVRCVARNSAARAAICRVITPNSTAQITALTAMIAYCSALSQAAGQEIHRHVTIGETRIGKPEEDDDCQHEFGDLEGARQRTPKEIT